MGACLWYGLFQQVCIEISLKSLKLLQVVIGMDVAASEFYGKDKTDDLNFKEEVLLFHIFSPDCYVKRSNSLLSQRIKLHLDS